MSDILTAFLENEEEIRRYVRRFCSTPDEVEDIIQETFLKGFAAEIKTEIRSPRPFLFRIAKNVALGQIRKNKNSPTDDLEDSGGTDIIIDEGQVSADETIDGRRKLMIFAMAVATLPPQCRRAFLMRRVDELQYKQIANRLNISVSAVEKHVANGLVRCVDYLRENGHDPSDFGALRIPKKSTKSGNSDAREKLKSDD